MNPMKGYPSRPARCSTLECLDLTIKRNSSLALQNLDGTKILIHIDTLYKKRGKNLNGFPESQRTFKMSLNFSFLSEG